MKKISPHLWFDKQAREAAEFYVSVLPGSKVTHVTTLSGTPSGDCDLVSFELAGMPFMAISAGPLFQFNPSVSFHIKCGTKEEVDAIWERISPGGKVLMPLGTYPFSERFGWLEDRYGISWQVIHAGENPGDQRITPALLFAGEVCGKAEEAANLYASVFQGAPQSSKSGENKVEVLSRYGGNEAPEKEGNVRYAHFFLAGQEFGCMDSAREHKFKFNEAISFIVPCETQEEIDYFWDKLAADPNAGQCGWIKDKFGLSWQIVPANMQQFMGGDKQRAARVTQAFMKMKKFDMGALERAAAG